MSCYWFNRQKLLEKAKGRYHNRGGKENASEYYISNKDVIKEKPNSKVQKLVRRKKRSKKRI